MHRCAHLCVHVVFICASTCKCLSIYGGQRKPPWVLFFGNNSSCFWNFLDIVAHWSGACQVGSLDWLVNTRIHLPPPPQCLEYKHMLPHLGSVLVGCFGFWQGFWRLKSGPLFTVSWASPSLTTLYLKYFVHLWPYTPECTLSGLMAEAKKARVQLILS